MKEAVQIIVNADDFGFSEAVNYGILKAFEKGIVTSTSIMANMPGFDHAVELAKQHPDLHIGVHMNVTCGKPLLESEQTLTNEKGYFIRNHEEEASDEELYAEICAQIEKVKNAGLVIDHLDSHHHIHTEPRFAKVIERVLETYPLPIRGGFLYPCDYPQQSILCQDFYDQKATQSDLKQIVSAFESDKIYDLMCHPAYIDDVLVDFSSYRMQRIEELRILCSEETKSFMNEGHIELITYSNL